MRHTNANRPNRLDCWKQFLLLEHRLLTGLKWVEPADKNFSCYSRELSQLIADCYPQLMAAALTFSPEESGFTPGTDEAVFHAAICHHHPNIHDFKVGLNGYPLKVRPWGVWRSSDALPDWWQAAELIHGNDRPPLEKATLRNALNAVGGLFVLLLLGGARNLQILTPGNRLLMAGSYLTRSGVDEVLTEPRLA